MKFIIATIFLIWVMGFYHIWRRQTASIEYVPVTSFDRIIAVFWPLLYLILFFLMALNWCQNRDWKF